MFSLRLCNLPNAFTETCAHLVVVHCNKHGKWQTSPLKQLVFVWANESMAWNNLTSWQLLPPSPPPPQTSLWCSLECSRHPCTSNKLSMTWQDKQTDQWMTNWTQQQKAIHLVAALPLSPAFAQHVPEPNVSGTKRRNCFLLPSPPPAATAKVWRSNQDICSKTMQRPNAGVGEGTKDKPSSRDGCREVHTSFGRTQVQCSHCSEKMCYSVALLGNSYSVVLFETIAKQLFANNHRLFSRDRNSKAFFFGSRSPHNIAVLLHLLQRRIETIL